MQEAIVFTITGTSLGLVMLCIARGIQVLILTVYNHFKHKIFRSYSDYKATRLDEWERKFDDSNY